MLNIPFELKVKELPDRYSKGATRVDIISARIPQPIAIVAIDFINKWGMIAGQLDGEDSAGRAKVRLATPQELVDRAIETAELTFKAIQDKGWVLDVPEPKEPQLTNGEK